MHIGLTFLRVLNRGGGGGGGSKREQNGGIECVECSFNGIAAAFRVTGGARERARERDSSSSTTHYPRGILNITRADKKGGRRGRGKIAKKAGNGMRKVVEASFRAENCAPAMPKCEKRPTSPGIEIMASLARGASHGAARRLNIATS